MIRETYHILKASEGGTTIKDAKAMARVAGLHLIETFDSFYVGHFALAATGTKRQHAAFEKVL